MKRIGFNFLNFGIYLYVINFFKNTTTFFITPSLVIDFINGANYYLDFEIRFLCFGFGIHLVVTKNYTFKYPFWKIFNKNKQ